MRQTKNLWKTISVASVILLILTNCIWFYKFSTVKANYCVIANGGSQIEPNWNCEIKDVTEEKVTVVLYVKQGTQYSGIFIIDRSTNKVIDKNEVY